MDLLIHNELFYFLIERITTSIMKEAGFPRKHGTQKKRDHNLEEILYYINGVMAVRRLWHDTGYRRSVYEVAEAICSLAPKDMIERW